MPHPLITHHIRQKIVMPHPLTHLTSLYPLLVPRSPCIIPIPTQPLFFLPFSKGSKYNKKSSSSTSKSKPGKGGVLNKALKLIAMSQNQSRKQNSCSNTSTKDEDRHHDLIRVLLLLLLSLLLWFLLLLL